MLVCSAGVSFVTVWCVIDTYLLQCLVFLRHIREMGHMRPIRFLEVVHSAQALGQCSLFHLKLGISR